MARVEGVRERGDELYSIDEHICINCGSCRRFCPVDCIPYTSLRHRIDQERCIGCTICYAVCPVDAVVIDVPRHSRVDLSPAAVQRVKEHTLARGPFFQERRRGRST
jgi:MinD superfamily P-loop ATPase